jgi:hypothetical protein
MKHEVSADWMKTCGPCLACGWNHGSGFDDTWIDALCDAEKQREAEES